MYLPYALAPCGHSACYGCLVNWFKAPQNDEHAAEQIPAYLRKKTCPHCRAIVKERPTEVWNIKDMVDSLVKSKFVPPHPDPPVVANRTADFDAWAGIFRKAFIVPPVADLLYPHRHYHHLPLPAPVPALAEGGAHGGNNNAPPHPPPLQLMGMLDEEDGGIYRCIDCYHEIWGGVCSHCRRVYPGHDASDDEDDDAGSDVVWNDFADGSELDDEDEAFVHNHLGAWPAPGNGNPYDRVGHWLAREYPMRPLDQTVAQRYNPEDHGPFHDYGLPDPQLMGEDGDDDEEAGAEDNESYEGSFIDDGPADDEDRDYHGLMEANYPDGFGPTRIIAPGPRTVGPSGRLTRIWEDEDDEADEEWLYGAGPSRGGAGVRGRSARGVVITDEEDQATERGDDEDEDLAEQVAAEES